MTVTMTITHRDDTNNKGRVNVSTAKEENTHTQREKKERFLVSNKNQQINISND